jgi:Pyridine nucleotide-disulphide oxidoreductase
VPGDRPAGVYTTGQLQRLLHPAPVGPVGTRAVVVGAEHVSFSALLTLAHGGARAVAMVTEHARHESFAAVRAGAALRFRAPLLTRTSITAIEGRRRVEAVEVTRLDTGAARELGCDLVVFTADWIPDHELAVLGGAVLDPGTRGPAVDPSLRTSRPRVFAAGNVLHGAEPADVAALSGRHVAAAVVKHLAGEPWPSGRLSLVCQPPLRWIAPNALAAGDAPARGRFLLRAEHALRAPAVEVVQGPRTLWRGRVPRLGPGRSARLPSTWTDAADAGGGPIVVRVVAGRRRARA